MDRLDGHVLRAWALGARASLAVAAPLIDAVNVFPVADADTGTNVLLTVEGALGALEDVPADAPVPDVARALARGAVVAARGNSGVIVSQFLAGFAHALPGAPGAADVAGALDAAARAARTAVAEPQEGTVLSLADVVAAEALRRSAAGADVPAVLDGAAADAHRALAGISAEHPVLRRAHVLDAGACALVVVLDALAAAVRGLPAATTQPDWLPTAPPAAGAGPVEGGAFEVMLVVRAAADVGAALRGRLQEVGDSVAVVGADGWWHVHVHTDDPAEAVARSALGTREQVVVRLVDAPHAGHGPSSGWGLVVCTAAPALAPWFAAAGAVTVVRCPETSVTPAHVSRAVEDTGAPSVVLVPGSGLAPDEATPLLDGGAATVEVLGAADELRAVVATLGFAGAGGASAPAAAALALGRLRAWSGDDAVEGARTLLAGRADVAGLTVVHRDPAPADLADRLDALVAGTDLDVEPVLVGPTGTGPAFLVGVD